MRFSRIGPAGEFVFVFSMRLAGAERQRRSAVLTTPTSSDCLDRGRCRMRGIAQRFEQADRVVVEAFADLHEARHLRSNPAISPGAVLRFERKA